MCVAQANVRPRPFQRRLLRPSSLPLTGTILQEKIYGHANYPLKLRETKPRPSANLPRRPRGVPPSSRTFKIQPIKLFEKLRLASNFPSRHIIGFRDQIFNLRSPSLAFLTIRCSSNVTKLRNFKYSQSVIVFYAFHVCIFVRCRIDKTTLFTKH